MSKQDHNKQRGEGHFYKLRSAGADVLLLDNCSASQLETAVCEAGV